MDADVEQYWLLLAFALRHLGHRDCFEKIVFGKDRNLSRLLSTASKPLAAPHVQAVLGEMDSFGLGAARIVSAGGLEWSWAWTGFLRELVEVRGSEQQLAQYVAVKAQIRKSLDDWIPARRLASFLRFAQRVGLAVEIDCTFRSFDETTKIPGSSLVPTTQAYGAAFDHQNLDEPDASIHVFVSSRPDWAANAVAAGWYSVAIGDRLVRKPQIDHQRLGTAFGYPPCCIDFFLKHNDWPRTNTLAEAYAQTQVTRWQTNCLAKHSPFMAVFHLPCSFQCAATCEYTEGVLDEVKKLDSAYAEQTKLFMRQSYLAISEVLCYALVGARGTASGRTAYRNAIYTGGKRHMDRLSESLAEGDEIAVAHGTVLIWREGQIVRAFDARCDGGQVEVPVLLHFE
jgi:hypothetical protein